MANSFDRVVAFGYAALSDRKEVIVFEVFFVEFLFCAKACLEVCNFLLEFGMESGLDVS
jgi:hypothetical protein